MSQRTNRRRFLGYSAAAVTGIAGGLTARTLLAQHGPNGFIARLEAGEPIPRYRTLGRTGLEVTTIGFGLMRLQEAAVASRAVQLGVNYFDTADCYQSGNNEVLAGKALGPFRDNVLIASKVHVADEERMVASIERSFKRLGVETIDLMQLHGISAKRHVTDETAQRVLKRYKESGRIRAVGVTTHSNMDGVVNAVVDDGFYDTVLVTFNHNSSSKVAQALKRAHEAGHGVIAMKTQAGSFDVEGLNHHQAALRWALSHEYVHTTIPGMVNLQELQENVTVMESAPTADDDDVLNAYRSENENRLCRLCEECVGTCPQEARIPDVNRSVMYADGYGDLELGRQTYASTAAAGGVPCAACSSCVARCSRRVDIVAQLNRAAELFA